jgi:hypothetical protein
MGLKLRWSQEIEDVMGKTGKCYLVTCHQRLPPVRLDSDDDKLNIEVRAGMGRGFGNISQSYPLHALFPVTILTSNP